MHMRMRTCVHVHDGSVLQVKDSEKKMRRALEEQLAELVGGHSKEMQEMKQREAEEKQARIEGMRSSGMKRLMNLELSRAWSSWQVWWEEAIYEDQLMRRAGGRMRNPQVRSAARVDYEP